uniref:WW domain binding protein 1-like b n=1 Tax=Gouania willdenowi TaxID=441366 RepID=A0A8C5EY36_GOUWI
QLVEDTQLECLCFYRSCSYHGRRNERRLLGLHNGSVSARRRLRYPHRVRGRQGFWLVWAIIFILCICCVCHHRRTKHRLQQQQRQHEINLIAYHEAHNYPSVPFYFRFLPNYLLPDYEEVVNRPPTPPPPYSALHTGPSSVVTSPLASEQQEGTCAVTQSPSVTPITDTLCSRASTEEPQPPSLDFSPKPDNKPAQVAQDSGVILSEGHNRDSLSQEKRGEEDSCKDPLLKDLSLEDKERFPSARRRRFTGDSGIEVCVCGTRGGGSCSSAGGTGPDGKELRELESLLGREEEEQDTDFCDSCGYRASICVEEEQQQAPKPLERRAGRGPQTGTAPAPPPAQHVSSSSSSSSPHSSVCLLLHTINEQEGPAHNTSITEPQG